MTTSRPGHPRGTPTSEAAMPEEQVDWALGEMLREALAEATGNIVPGEDPTR
ncbi:MAG TPA: hypothetical protein VIK12_09660 [Pengzhenrongella sp.]